MMIRPELSPIYSNIVSLDVCTAARVLHCSSCWATSLFLEPACNPFCTRSLIVLLTLFHITVVQTKLDVIHSLEALNLFLLPFTPRALDCLGLGLRNQGRLQMNDLASSKNVDSKTISVWIPRVHLGQNLFLEWRYAVGPRLKVNYFRKDEGTVKLS